MTLDAPAVPYPAPPRGVSGRSSRDHALALTRRSTPLIPMLSVTLVSLLLNAWSLSRAGYGNTYYAAAARSMTVSWKNFFFGAFDPGGFITVDKPPAFLWVDALSARIFGYSTWSILLPSAVAGAVSVALLWFIVRRQFGATAATIAGLVLALTPISVAVNRLNLPEPFLILALVAAAGAVLRSLDSPRWWAWIAAAGCAVGIAFNTKMLVGWIPGPAFVAAIAVGVAGARRVSWRAWLPRIALLGAATLVISASWLVVVDRWPASDRPYIGGSTDNTVQDLVLGYNGIDRVEGNDQGFPSRPANAGANPPANAGAPAGAPAQGGPPGGAPGGANGPGGIIAGQPGPFRMFDAANGGQIAWFLPLAGLGSLLSLWLWRRDRTRRAQVLLWLGWTLTFGLVFSFAEGIYHSYYTSAMAPGVAALTGISAVAAVEAIRRHPAWLAAPVVLVASTLAVQLKVAGRVPYFYGWVRPFTVVLAVAGVVVLLLCLWRRRPLILGLAVSLAGLLLLPAAWSLSETANASLNASLPQAGPRGGVAGRTFGSAAFDDGAAELATWLEAHADPEARWQLVTASSQNGSTLIAQYEVSVMALGGFSGRDQAITVAEFADVVARGDARYVFTLQQGPRGRGGGPNGPAPANQPPGIAPGGPNAVPRNGGPSDGQPPFAAPRDGTPTGAAPQDGAGPNAGPGAGPGTNAVMAAVRSGCTPVRDPTLPARYQGQFYDCAGRAEALRALGG